MWEFVGRQALGVARLSLVTRVKQGICRVGLLRFAFFTAVKRSTV